MKRRIRHVMIWGLIAVGGVVMANRWLNARAGSDGGNGSTVPDSARARPSVVLDRVKWTAFRIPSTAVRVKLLSRANLAGQPESLVDLEFPYEIEYRLESLTGNTVAEGDFALVAQVPLMEDADGQPRQAAYFRGSELAPSAAKTSILDLASGEISILKLRAKEFSEPVVDVSMRLFVRQQIPERKLAFLWNRLSQDSRSRIGEGRIHALVDLSLDEKRSILQNRWSPSGAQGVTGIDYEERTIYLRDDLFPANRILVEPLGVGEIRCGANRRAIIGIPPSGGELRLEFRRLEDIAPATAKIRYFGETILERSSHDHQFDAHLTGFSATLRPGLLEIESPVGVAVRSFLTPEGQGERLLEPDPTVVRAWRVNGGEVVAFELGGERRQGDFFRVSARPVAGREATLQFEFLDAAGSVVQAAKREIPAAPSLYDLLLTPDGEIPVNDPVELILELPAGVNQIRFRADTDVLLVGYTRPATLPHRTRVPADYVRALPDPERLPTWFGLRPEGGDDLVRSSRSFLIHTQTRPPEDDADILAGKYQWEDFQPVEGALGQYLLSDRDPESPSRDEALPSLFMPLAVGMEQPLALANPPGLELPSRRLAYVRNGRGAVPLQILIDGAMFFQRDLVTGRGELLLPPIPVDSRTIRIESPEPGLQCFLNYVQAEKATKLKRLAQRISAGSSLVYQCEKATSEDELLTGMYFAPPGVEEEAEIQVTIRPGESGGFLPEAETFTPRHRLYFIAPDPAVQTPVLGGKIPVVDGGRRFFIPMGSDLRAGDYEVTITMHDGSEGYLTLSKITAGDYSDARFFREADR